MMAAFDEHVRQLMKTTGVGLRELSRRTHYNAGYLSRVVNGRQKPSREVAEVLDRALDADGSLIARVSISAPSGLLTPDDEERLLLAARNPRRVDTAVVDSLAVTLAGQRRLEDAIGPALLIEPVKAQLAVIERLVVDARGPVRAKVLDVAHQWAQFTGWLHTPIGQHEVARNWFDRAAEWALEVGDMTMISTTLTFKGQLSWIAGRVGPMVGLSQAARRDQNASVGQRAFAAHQEARGHAMAGDGDAVDRALGAADLLAVRAAEHPEDEPPWLYVQTPEFFTLQHGLTYRYLGRDDRKRNGQAIECLRAGLAGLPDDQRGAEWAGEFVYHLAVAYVQGGEPEQACAVATDAAVIVENTRAVRLRSQLEHLHARLVESWPTLPAVVELGERLNAA